MRAVQQSELNTFGAERHLHKKELKGSTLLDKKRFKFAGQLPQMNEEERRKHCRSCRTKGLEKRTNQETSHLAKKKVEVSELKDLTDEEKTAMRNACENNVQLTKVHEVRETVYKAFSKPIL